MTINTIYHSNIVSWPPLLQPPLLQHCLPPPTTPTPARKPSICHESSYSFSPIPIVLLSSVVIQFSSVTYEPAYELFLFRMLDLANNTPTIIQNSNIIISMIMIYPSMTMPPTLPLGVSSSMMLHHNTTMINVLSLTLHHHDHQHHGHQEHSRNILWSFLVFA